MKRIVSVITAPSGKVISVTEDRHEARQLVRELNEGVQMRVTHPDYKDLYHLQYHAIEEAI